jgi:hypothetical protein
MRNSAAIRLAILASAGIAFLAVWATTGKTEITFAKWIVTASTLVIFALVGFDTWAWRFWPFRLLVRKPILHGTWKLEQKTSYEPRKDDVMEAYLVIDQTFSGIRRVHGLYEESRSHSLTSSLSSDRSECSLSFIFRSDAHIMNREGNPPSRGASVLEIGRHPEPHLQGDYWMERGTHGRVRSIAHSKKLYGTFESAQNGFDTIVARV